MSKLAFAEFRLDVTNERGRGFVQVREVVDASAGVMFIGRAEHDTLLILATEEGLKNLRQTLEERDFWNVDVIDPRAYTGCAHCGGNH